jgi:hypothetical protein
MITRRQLAAVPLTAAACGQPKQETGWPAAWDRLLLEQSIKATSLTFDPSAQMISAILGPEYRYHTKLRQVRAHPTRESLEYALYLLEEGSQPSVERAHHILDTVLPLQVTDPESQWYGIWGWYREEPPDKMAPADWNWADFNGSLLLVIDYRQAERLGPERRQRVREAIRHAAYSIKRRNVSMGYTNIAVKGTFVTLAAAEILNDSELADYAHDRIIRLAQQIDLTGSFDEYNSPTYARVAITNLTRIRMYVKHEESRRRAALIERRFWLHLASHFDPARRQFAGPMSRCYGNDIGQPAWLEKALNGRLGLVNPRNRSGPDAETAIHDYRCPADLVSQFTVAAPGHEHRELFLAKPETSGVTWFSRDFSLGSVNRGDFWVQRRPLLAYFGDATRPARTAQLRIIKDGYDFSSALFFSVQSGPRVLALVNFRNPGGDKHISLDPIKDGQFECGRMFFQLAFEGLDEGFQHELEDHSIRLKSTHLNARLQILGARFGNFKPTLKATTSAQSLTITLDFKAADAPRLVRWNSLGEAYAAFALELADAGAALSTAAPQLQQTPGRAILQWGNLALEGATAVATNEEQQSAFLSRIDGRPAPVVRISNDKLA